MKYSFIFFGIIILLIVILIIWKRIKEKKNSEILLNNQEYLNAIIKNTPACVKVIDKTGRLISINSIGLNILEADSLDDVIGHNVFGIVTDEYREQFKELTNEVCLNGKSIDLIFEIVGLKGNKKWMETKAIPLKYKNGNTKLLAFSEDITERVRVQDELSKSETLKNTILSSITDAFFALDKDWKLTYLNQQAEDLFNKNKADLIGRNFWDEYPEMNMNHFYKKYISALKDQKQIEFEYYYPDSNKWLRVKIYPSNDGFSIFNTDITIEKIEQIFNDLERSMLLENSKGKKRLNEIFDYAIRVIESVYPGVYCSIHKINETQDKLVNYATSSFSKEIVDLASELSLSENWPCTDAIAKQKKIILQGIQSQNEYPQLKSAIRNTSIVSCLSIPLFTLEKEPLGVFTLFFENYISEEYHYLKTLNKLQEIFRSILENRKYEDDLTKLSLIAKNTSKAVFISNLEQEITWVNDAFTEMTGYKNDEVLGKHPFDLLNGIETDQEIIESLKIHIKNNELIAQNILFHKKNGATYWSRITGQPMYDEIGTINQYFVIQEDITIRKLAKLDLQDSEKRYRALFHTNPQPMFIYDKSTLRFIEVNESAINTYGYTSFEFNSMLILDLFSATDSQIFLNNDKRINNRNNLLLNTEIKYEEYIHHTKNGKMLNVEMVRNEIVLSGKETILVIINDVTNKLVIEKELRRSNERFLIASKAVSDIIWEWDVTINKYIWGDGIKEGFGYNTENEYPTAENFKEFIHPDDADAFFKNYTALIKNKNENYWSAEYRFKKKDGTYANVLDKAYVIRTNNGTAVKIIGALRDVTEEKNHESEKAKLIEQTQEFERKRFSMELHDGLAQQLIVLNLYLSQFEEGEEVDSVLLKNCFDVVKASLNQTRSMCYNLTPPELENGLLLALKAMFDRFKTLNAMDFVFEFPEWLTNSDFENIDEYNIYRIIQEFVNNSIKHAQGSKIECKILKRETHLEINLIDNGVGFDHTLITNGLGLNNIEKRAKLANVKCYLTSEINEGTHLKIII